MSPEMNPAALMAGGKVAPLPAGLLRPGSGDGCLRPLWELQAHPDRMFDRAHDRADGGRLSCTLGTTAGALRIALDRLAKGCARGPAAARTMPVDYPLTFIGRDGDGFLIHGPRELAASWDTVFTPAFCEFVVRIEIEHVAIVPYQGAMFGLGALWLTVPPRGHRPLLGTVNHRAFAEAHELANAA